MRASAACFLLWALCGMLAVTGILKLAASGAEPTAMLWKTVGGVELVTAGLLLWMRTRVVMLHITAALFLGLALGAVARGPDFLACPCFGDVEVGWQLRVAIRGLGAALGYAHLLLRS